MVKDKNYWHDYYEKHPQIWRAYYANNKDSIKITAKKREKDKWDNDEAYKTRHKHTVAANSARTRTANSIARLTGKALNALANPPKQKMPKFKGRPSVQWRKIWALFGAPA